MYLLENCTVLSDTFGMAEGDKLDFYRAPDGRIVSLLVLTLLPYHPIITCY